MGIPPSQLAYTEGGKFLTPEQFHVVLQTMKKMNQGKTIGVESKVKDQNFLKYSH